MTMGETRSQQLRPAREGAAFACGLHMLPDFLHRQAHMRALSGKPAVFDSAQILTDSQPAYLPELGLEVWGQAVWDD